MPIISQDDKLRFSISLRLPPPLQILPLKNFLLKDLKDLLKIFN